MHYEAATPEATKPAHGTTRMTRPMARRLPVMKCDSCAKRKHADAFTWSDKRCDSCVHEAAPTTTEKWDIKVREKHVHTRRAPADIGVTDSTYADIRRALPGGNYRESAKRAGALPKHLKGLLGGRA